MCQAEATFLTSCMYNLGFNKHKTYRMLDMTALVYENILRWLRLFFVPVLLCRVVDEWIVSSFPDDAAGESTER